MASNTPAYQAATTGAPANAGFANQLLGSHTATFLYSGGKIITQQTTGSGSYQGSQNNWASQTIVTGSSQTAIGSVNLQLNTVGGSPTLNLIPVLTVGLYADGSGFPSGTPLVSTTVSNNYVYTAPFWVSIPLPATGLTPSTQYHIVTNLVGSSAHYYAWQQSTQTSGAATAPDGVVWTFRSFGMMYQVLDQTSTGQVATIFEDNGARFTTLTYNGTSQVASVTEFVTAQGGGYIQSSGTLSYTNGLLTGVS